MDRSKITEIKKKGIQKICNPNLKKHTLGNINFAFKQLTEVFRLLGQEIMKSL